MTNKEFNKLMRALGMHCRRKAVEHLLAGNDTQCFTTAQYLDAYAKVNWKDKEESDVERHRRMKEWLSVYVRDHLLSVPDMVREVKPDVWAGVQNDLFLEEVF